MFTFTGYHLIAYVRSWLNAVNEVAIASGLPSVCSFNTYIVSVLVIFYLQLNQLFPILSNVPASNAKCMDRVPPVDKEYFKRSVQEFFEFYGRKYELKNQLISVNVGLWQNPRLTTKRSNLTHEQKR